MINYLKYIKMIFKILRVIIEKFAKYKLERNKLLIKELNEYLKKTGINWV